MVMCIYLSFQHASNVQLLFCTLRACHATCLPCKDTTGIKGAAVRAQAATEAATWVGVGRGGIRNSTRSGSRHTLGVVRLHQLGATGLVFLAAPWLLGSCPSGTPHLRAMPCGIYSNWPIAYQ